MKTGFIYIWYDRKHKKYYVGSHLGTEDDGYVCSSRWMRKSYKRRPQDFRRRILQRDIEKARLKEVEYEWLKLIKEEELGVRYYNLNNRKILKPGNWPEGKSRSEETKKKLSEKGKLAWLDGRSCINDGNFKPGQEPWNKGKKGVYTEQTIEKIKIARKQQVFSKESIEKRSSKLRGKPRDQETIRKMVETKRIKKEQGLYKQRVPWNKGMNMKGNNT